MYEKFLHNPEIEKIHGAINGLYADILLGCHGRQHALTVVETTAQVLAETGHDAQTIELGKIAALLHDIGVIAGRHKHAQKSAALARVFLEDEKMCELRNIGTRRQIPSKPGEVSCATKKPGNSCETEISGHLGEMLLQAIADHSDGENICSAIGAAVIIGDKTDLSKQRIFPDVTDPIYKNLRELEAVELEIAPKMLVVNFIGTKNFDEELFIRDYVHEYKKGYDLTKKAAKFLGMEYEFQIKRLPTAP
ncbi:MAG: hypothetical protein FWC70_11405 [Defluviitaleaceae bacterium]|nr:hypothetical protein [Defluviitaleaceae bacterium]